MQACRHAAHGYARSDVVQTSQKQSRDDASRSVISGCGPVYLDVADGSPRYRLTIPSVRTRRLLFSRTWRFPEQILRIRPHWDSG